MEGGNVATVKDGLIVDLNNLSPALKKFAENFDAKNGRSFPAALFPDQIKEIINHYCHVFKYPVDWFGCAIISASATAIGASYQLQAGAYRAISSVYLMVVGSPGLNKSAPVTHAYKPLFKIQGELYKEYLQAYAEWKSHDKEYKASVPEPTYRPMVLNDATQEAVINTLNKNNRGVGIYKDELAGWFKGHNQYRKGGDLEFYLEVFQGQSISKSRSLGGDVFISDPVVNIIGTTQPDIFQSLLEGNEANGGIDRFLISYLPEVKKEYPSDETLNQEIERQYFKLIQRLHELQMPDGHIHDNVLYYSDQAKKEIDKWVRDNTDKSNDSDEDSERAIRAKMDIYVHRLALICNLMKYAVSDNSFNRFCVEIDVAKLATSLANYFLNMALSLRIDGPRARLGGKWKEVFDMLPPDEGTFTTTAFVQLAEAMGIGENTANKFLQREAKKGNGAIEKVKHGVYSKRI